MKKNKLKLKVESLRLLDGHNAFGAATDAATCQPSCPATCGIVPATTNQAARAAVQSLGCANSDRVCCV